jgi:anti-anti-sigma factor
MSEYEAELRSGEPNRENRSTTEARWLAPGVMLVVLAGEHDLGTAEELDATLGRALESCSRLVVDLGAAEFIDSSTIRVLCVAKERADRQGCRFSLVLGETAPVVENALHLSGVLPILNRVDTVGQALAGVGAEARGGEA